MTTKAIYLLLLCVFLHGFPEAVTASSGQKSRKILQKSIWSCERPGPFPYISSLRNEDGNHYCTGVLVGKSAVLTNAHCVDPDISSDYLKTPEVYIGTNQYVDDYIEKRRSIKVYYHKYWTSNLYKGFDLAILQLEKKVECVKPVPYFGQKYPDAKTYSAYGYGRVGQDSTGTTTLMVSNMTRLDNEKCNKNKYLKEPVTVEQYCFLTTDGIGASLCTGDDGAPFIYTPTSPDYNDTLVALYSYTDGADCGEKNSVNVAMNINRFKKFIKKTIEKIEKS